MSTGDVVLAWLRARRGSVSYRADGTVEVRVGKHHRAGRDLSEAWAALVDATAGRTGA